MNTVRIHIGEEKDILLYTNLSDRLYYKITNEPGTNSVGFLLIKRPLGSVENLGKVSGSGFFGFKGFISGRLKALDVDSKTVIQITERIEIADTFPPIHF